MKNFFSVKFVAVTLRVVLMALLVMPPMTTIVAQKSLNSSHQMSSNSNGPKKNKGKGKKNSDNDDFKATGRAQMMVKKQNSNEAAEKAAAAKAAADSIKAESERKAAMAAGTYVDSTIYNPIDIKVELSMYNQAPSFPGGTSEMGRFISENINYPRALEKAQVEGRVVCQLIISSEGEILDVNVFRGVHPALDTEAVRIIKLMPHWNPAKLDGVPVNCKYNLPMYMSPR